MDIDVRSPLLGWPLRELAQIELRALFRSGVFFTIAAASITTLAFALPVARYYQVADYELGRFDIEIVGVIGPQQLQALEEIAEPGSLVGFNAFAPASLAAGDKSVGVTLYLTRTPDRIDGSWFAPDALIAEGPVSGNWLDITADAARGLGISPGDKVSTPLGGGRYEARIRRILAIDQGGFPAAVGPLTAEAASLVPVDPQAAALFPDASELVTETLLRTRASIADVAAAVASAPKSDSFVIRRRTDVLRQLDAADPLSTMSVVVAISAIGLGCFIGLAIREAGQLIRRRRTDLVVLAALGASRVRIVVSVVALELVVVTIAFVAAWAFVTTIGFGSLLAAAFPPVLRLPLALALALAGMTYLAALGGATWYQVRETKLVEVLATRTSR